MKLNLNHGGTELTEEKPRIFSVPSVPLWLTNF